AGTYGEGVAPESVGVTRSVASGCDRYAAAGADDLFRLAQIIAQFRICWDLDRPIFKHTNQVGGHDFRDACIEGFATLRPNAIADWFARSEIDASDFSAAEFILKPFESAEANSGHVDFHAPELRHLTHELSLLLLLRQAHVFHDETSDGPSHRPDAFQNRNERKIARACDVVTGFKIALGAEHPGEAGRRPHLAVERDERTFRCA